MILAKDGGTWAAHTVRVCSEQLKVVETSVDKIKVKQSELVQNLKVEYLKRNENLLAQLTSSVPHHLEDVTFLETVSRQQEEASR
jgi:hypothetical protein